MDVDMAIEREKCAATVGFFDGVHRGHRYLIEQVKAEAEREGIASVVVTFDRHPKEVVASASVPKMLCSTEDKIAAIENTGVTRCVVLPFTHELSEMTAETFMRSVLWERLGVIALITGYDNRFGHGREEGFEDYVRHGQAMGMRVVRALPLIEDGVSISSSAIRCALSTGDIATATRYLGRRYTISGTIISGQHIGHALGFPTANVSLEHTENMLPGNGVYVVMATVEGYDSPMPAMMNIGTRPTFGGKSTTLEVHIFDFTGDIYRRRMTIAFHERLRAEQHFESTQALTAQLATDAEQARSILKI